MPKVSLCIPTFRQVDYLRLTLASVALQTYQDFEIIVSDDSPDDSVETLLEGFDFKGRLRYIRNEAPLGSPSNWNAAVDLAQGEYIKILHHDDCFLGPDSLAKFVDLLDNNPRIGFAFCACRILDAVTGKEEILRTPPRSLADLRNNPAVLFSGNIVGVPSVTIYRREFALPYDPNMMWLVDIDFYMRVLVAGAGFVYSADPLVSITSSAGHQLTKYCRENEEIELRESMLMFSKIEESSRNISEIIETWYSLFERFHIHSFAALKTYHALYPELKMYFLDLIIRYRHQRYFSLMGLNRLFSGYSSLFPDATIIWLRRMKHRLIR